VTRRGDPSQSPHLLQGLQGLTQCVQPLLHVTQRPIPTTTAEHTAPHTAPRHAPRRARQHPPWWRRIRSRCAAAAAVVVYQWSPAAVCTCFRCVCFTGVPAASENTHVAHTTRLARCRPHRLVHSWRPACCPRAVCVHPCRHVSGVAGAGGEPQEAAAQSAARARRRPS
jgi:hypothetical protein